MGNFISTAKTEQPSSIVLVPPLMDSRERGRSRFAKSAYERVFGQQQLRILFQDFLPYGLNTALRFSPPEDPRVSVVAKVGTAVDKALNPEGKMSIRYQPDPNIPWTFIDIKAHGGRDYQNRAVALRGCFFNPAISNFSIFGIVPLFPSVYECDPTKNKTKSTTTQVGMSYRNPFFSAGAIFLPTQNGTLASAWTVGRAGSFIFGVETKPNIPLIHDINENNNIDNTNNVRGVFMPAAFSPITNSLSWGLAYRPNGQSAYGKGVFTASLQFHNQKEMIVSVMHHMATQRNVVNPLEKGNVVGITNYLDLAVQMVMTAPRSMMRLAGAWQVNKNVQVKARLDEEEVTCGVILKAWWHPALTLGIAISRPFWNMNPWNPLRVGMTVTLESYKALRYERSKFGESTMAGGRVTQRHVASDEDIAYHQGEGLLVPLDEVDNPTILGQNRTPTGTDYM